MQRKKGKKQYYSTMTPYSHGDDSALYHQNPSFNPNNTISTFAENPNYHAHHHQQTQNHHVIGNVASNHSTLVGNPNGHYQEITQHHHRHQIIPTHVADHVNVARNNNGSLKRKMVGLSVEEWPYEYPPGYRFCPEDGELIYYYLRRRIMELSLPHDKIKDVNLYRTIPDKVTAEHEPVGENDWYFFTPRNRKYRNGKRPNRAAGTGYWKATGADKPVRFKGEVVGYRKALVFYHGKAPKGQKTNWIMHEYKVLETEERERIDEFDMKLDDWVLCRIYNKKGNSSSRTKSKAYKKKKEPTPPISEPNSPNSLGSIDEEESHAQPEMVVKDKKTFLPFSPNPEFIEFDYADYYDKILYEESLQKYIFSSHNLRSILNNCRPLPNPSEFVDTEVGLDSCFYDFQANNFRHGLINGGEIRPSSMSNPVYMENNGFPNSFQESVLLPLEEINSAFTPQNGFDCFSIPNIATPAPSQESAAGEFALHCPPSKRHKYV